MMMSTMKTLMMKSRTPVARTAQAARTINFLNLNSSASSLYWTTPTIKIVTPGSKGNDCKQHKCKHEDDIDDGDDDDDDDDADDDADDDDDDHDHDHDDDDDDDDDGSPLANLTVTASGLISGASASGSGTLVLDLKSDLSR